MTNLAQNIGNRLRAGAFVLVVQEADEILALREIEKATKGKPATESSPPVFSPFLPVTYMSGADPDAMTKLGELPKGTGTLVVSEMLAINGENPLAVRMIREVGLQMANRLQSDTASHLILIEQPGTKIPPGLVGDADVVASALPTMDELKMELTGFLAAQDMDLPGNGEANYTLAASVAGLARHEASYLFARCLVERGRKAGLDAAWLRSEKAKRVSANLGGALTFESTDGPDIGGLENLREWLAARKTSFSSQKARAFGLPEPKGLLCLGPPGVGKSATARSVARGWGLPLLRLDAGRLFGSLVGQSENQTRRAIEAAESCAPAVLWIDEIEKALAGGGSGSSTDGGTTQRVFGTLLTWLQDKKSPVFCVATANRISALPPELLRKGRFDEIFFVGLPNVNERRDIAKIHLERRGRGSINAGAIAEATSGFSGAEIEQAIVDGLFTAFAADRDLELADVVTAVKATSPLSKTMAEEIKAMETWAQGRARPASKPYEPGVISGAEMVARAAGRGPRIE